MPPVRKHILISGSDEYKVKERAEWWMRECAPDDTMNVEVIQARADNSDQACEKLRMLIEAVQTLPFFGGHKLVHLKDVNSLSDEVRGEKVAELWERVAEVLKQITADEVQVIISASGMDKRRTFVKKLLEVVTLEEYQRLDLSKARDAEAWESEVRRRMSEAGLEASPDVVEFLIEMVGNDSRALEQELEKLALYLHPQKRITEDAVRTMVSSSKEAVIWDWCDCVTAGNTSQALQLGRQLMAQGENEVGLLIILAGHMRLAALGRHLQETGKLKLRQSGTFLNTELSPDADVLLPRNRKGEKPNLFRLGRVVKQVSHRPSTQLFSALEVVHRTHAQLFQSGLDRQKLLEGAIMELCSL